MTNTTYESSTLFESSTLSESAAADMGKTIKVPQLMLVFRCDQPAAVGARISLADVEEVTIGRGSKGLTLERDGKGQFVSWTLRDDLLSRTHCRLRLEDGGWRLSDLKSKNGTYLGGRNVSEEPLRDGDMIRVGSAIFMFRFGAVRLERKNSGAIFGEGSEPSALSTLLPELEESWSQARGMAKTSLPLLICGETGAGKELIARELHALSEREGDLVAVNCGAIADSLLESELFGHARGAFSGAEKSSIGLVRRADHGSLFLDEIAELSEACQVALLRVLQENEVRPVGATDPIRVNVRIIAATHRDLAAEVTRGNFREDLYARLAGHSIPVPPLRQRREDLGLIVSQMFRGKLGEFAEHASFSSGAVAALLTYRFPRNIRELEHVLHRALALAAGDRVRTSHLPDEVRALVEPTKRAASSTDEDLRERLVATLGATRGNVSETARRFGKAPIQVRRWLKRLKIDIAEFRK